MIKKSKIFILLGLIFIISNFIYIKDSYSQISINFSGNYQILWSKKFIDYKIQIVYNKLDIDGDGKDDVIVVMSKPQTGASLMAQNTLAPMDGPYQHRMEGSP